MYAYSGNNREYDFIFRLYLKDNYEFHIMKALALSGSLFSVSGLVAYQYQNYTTAYLSYVLAMTSIWFHQSRSTLSYTADQIALYSVILRSLFDGYSGGIPGTLIVLSITYYNYIIFFSSYSQYCCWHPVTGKQWHMTIHIVSVLGIILQQLCIKV